MGLPRMYGSFRGIYSMIEYVFIRYYHVRKWLKYIFLLISAQAPHSCACNFVPGAIFVYAEANTNKKLL